MELICGLGHLKYRKYGTSLLPLPFVLGHLQFSSTRVQLRSKSFRAEFRCIFFFCCSGVMNSVADQESMMDFLDDEVQVLQQMRVDVLDCEGIPCWIWNKKCVKLYNVDFGVLIGEGTIHSVDSELVLGASRPLGDAHVLVHVSMSHSEVDLPEEHVYSLVAWPIELVHYRGASLQNHEAWDNFNRLQAALLNPPSATSTRPYTSSIRNPTCDTVAKTQFLLTEESINLVSSNVCCGKICVQPFLGREFGHFVNGCIEIRCSNTEPS